MTRRRHRTITSLLGLHSPLGRWGFTTCAAFALLNGLIWPGLACAVLAAYAWRNR